VPLSDAELARFSRQLLLPGMSGLAQERLRAARVRVVGGGPIAGPALLYLAAAGVGTLYLDDAADVAPEDAAGWLYPPGRAGEARVTAALEALKAASAFARARIHATGADPTAALVCATGRLAREAAESARQAGILHAVVEGDEDGGAVVVVPPGAPCYSCAHRVGTGVAPPAPTAAALGALAAAELVLAISGALSPPQGRRVDLTRGEPRSQPTSRLPGCACAAGAA
jgi:adenylyltransferase/sulfurtransferase